MKETKRVLAGRYEIDSVLGQGGMAKVFRGTDRVLGRTVAVKVLAPEFAKDANFVTRFRREAQAAASLNHPNIVSVFDTGSANGVHYIVMELIEGRTLKDIIRTEGPLHPDRAVEIAQSVCRALDVAHEHGMVHRDVKPANIMITRDGDVKVMDFGIARTTTGETLTQTAAVLGTAAYLSPEQAQGHKVDLRSDIYAVGVVLYEMLTGRQPFTGDSPVTIAYKHVREDPVAPTRYNPDVSAELEAVTLKAMAKNPENRFQTAGEMLEDLNRVAAGMPVAATPVMGETEVIDRTPDRTAVLTGPMEEEAYEERARRRRMAFWITTLVLALLGVATFFLITSLIGPTVAVADVTGLKKDVAVERLEAQGLDPRIETQFSEQPKDVVIRQDPAPGTKVGEGSPVTLFVSKGPQLVPVPNVIGSSKNDAISELEASGFKVSVAKAPSDEQPKGVVFAQDPEGGRAQKGSTVSITVSTGPSTVPVPDVICDDLDTAKQKIEGAGLEYHRSGEQPDDACPAGTVSEQNPDPGVEVAPGTTVNVIESTGPEISPSP